MTGIWRTVTGEKAPIQGMVELTLSIGTTECLTRCGLLTSRIDVYTRYGIPSVISTSRRESFKLVKRRCL